MGILLLPFSPTSSTKAGQLHPRLKRFESKNQRRITLGEILAVTRFQMDAITGLEAIAR
jgi:hypothetical protein